MKVLALIENVEDVSYRYRLEAFAWALSEKDLFLEAVPVGRNWLRRVARLMAVVRADVVILQCNLLSHLQLAALRQLAGCLIYDLDSLPEASDPRELAPLRNAVREADAVVVGNDYLRLHVSAYTDPWRVHVVPTCIEPSWHRPAVHHRSTPAPRIVAIGLDASPGAAVHLAAVREKLPGASFQTAGGQDPKDADIAVSWLPENASGMGQCGLEVLQAMAAGLPIVANPVGVHRDMVIHGTTGLWAATPSQSAEAVKLLAVDPQLRSRLAVAGRRRVEEFYSVQHWQGHFAGLVHATAHRLPFSPSTEPLRQPTARQTTKHGQYGMESPLPPGEG
jgi:hypothetical protein